MNPSILRGSFISTFLTSGQIVIGQSKGYYCTGDGEVREFGKGGGGVPVYGKDFTYTGDYQILDDGNDNWRVKFLTSGTLKWLSDSIKIDIFLVGGGGSGGMNVSGTSSNAYECGTGGGGGYTKTVSAYDIQINTEYPIVIGDGGAGIAVGSYVTSTGNSGGSTSGFNVETAGGSGGNSGSTLATSAKGGAGGSGGGGCSAKSSSGKPGAGGSDGGNGEYGGDGQGTTTREFAEDTGNLYAGGGGCASFGGIQAAAGGSGGGGTGVYNGYTINSSSENIMPDGANNTGGGGGGYKMIQYDSSKSYTYRSSGSGGSGIVVIRNIRS